METKKQVKSEAGEKQARQELCKFVNEGLKDAQENAIHDFGEAFDALESRYKIVRAWCSSLRLGNPYGNGLTSVNDM